MEKEKYLITENCTVIEAMKLLDTTAKKVLFVAEDNKLLASLTDGDIRRWILSNGEMIAKVNNVANYNPKYVLHNDIDSAYSLMKHYSVDALPSVDSDMKIISIISKYEEDINKGNLKVPVVIMAGGLGTRLYPYTKILPKPLIPLGDIPISEYIINKFTEAGCDNFYLLLNHKKNMIKAYFNDIERDYEIKYIDEDKPLGTGGGLSLLKGELSKPFILSNCDIIINENYEKVYEYHKKEGNFITIVCSLKHMTIPYGVIEIDNNGNITDMKEKPQMTFLTNTGMYVVDNRVIDELEENTEIGFPDIIDRYRKENEKVGVYPISEDAWMDMGQFEAMEDMKRKLDINE